MTIIWAMGAHKRTSFQRNMPAFVDGLSEVRLKNQLGHKQLQLEGHRFNSPDGQSDVLEQTKTQYGSHL